MFYCMRITESIYEGVLTHSYRRSTWAKANSTGLSRNKRGESASSNTHTAKDDNSGKRCE